MRCVFASVISTLNGHSLIILEVPAALKMGGWELKPSRKSAWRKERERVCLRWKERERERERLSREATHAVMYLFTLEGLNNSNRKITYPHKRHTHTQAGTTWGRWKDHKKYHWAFSLFHPTPFDCLYYLFETYSVSVSSTDLPFPSSLHCVTSQRIKSFWSFVNFKWRTKKTLSKVFIII